MRVLAIQGLGGKDEGVEALRGWMAMRVYCRQGLNGIVSSALPVL